jgi:hypothetical protein
MVKLHSHVFEELGKKLAPKPPPPPAKKKRGGNDGWTPLLTPKQQEAFDSPARFVLTYGEKGSGKTIGLLHKLVRHCYENENALALILVRVKSMATKGGAWDKLVNHILPRWKSGNLEPTMVETRDGTLIPNPKAGQLMDEGLGLEFTDVGYDSQHNEFIWIENRHGGWSMVVLVSAPHANQLRDRMRGYEPSIALVDELTSCDSQEYLRAVAIQIGRREGIEGPQQYMAACNPEGPSHWVHVVWFEEAFDPVTGEWDEDYHKIHVPIRDNKVHLPPGYIEGLEKLYRNDPVEAARMLRGEWIDRPSGEALFRDIFVAANHIRPPLPTLKRLLPNPSYPIIVGLDPGAANNAFIFMQWMPVKGQMTWVVFDEMVYTQRRIRYDTLIKAVLRRVKFWNDLTFGNKADSWNGVGIQPSRRFRVVWSSDNSAFNQYRAAGGSYDVLDFEKIANVGQGSAPPLHKQLGLARMKVVAAPKFSGSVRQRTRLVMDLLGADQLLISAGCPKTIEMFNKLESESQKPNQLFDPDLAMTPKRSVHLHPYDAMCNPILTASISPQLLVPAPEGTQEMMSIGS